MVSEPKFHEVGECMQAKDIRGAIRSVLEEVDGVDLNHSSLCKNLLALERSL